MKSKYTMEQIGKAWDLAVATCCGFDEWKFSATAERVRLSLSSAKPLLRSGKRNQSAG